VLTTVGVLTIGKTRSKSEIPFAAIPLIFGVQQAVEGMIWLYPVGPSVVHSCMTTDFSFISHVFWPVFIPVAVLLIEKVQWRRRALEVFMCVGFVMGLWLLYLFMTVPMHAVILNHSINYVSSHSYSIAEQYLYLVAACLCCLFSSHRYVNLFGLLVFFSAVLTSVFWSVTFVSVWCFFSAIVSAVIYLQFADRRGRVG